MKKTTPHSASSSGNDLDAAQREQQQQPCADELEEPPITRRPVAPPRATHLALAVDADASTCAYQAVQTPRDATTSSSSINTSSFSFYPYQQQQHQQHHVVPLGNSSSGGATNGDGVTNGDAGRRSTATSHNSFVATASDLLASSLMPAPSYSQDDMDADGYGDAMDADAYAALSDAERAERAKEAHRARFLSNVERVVAADPARARESFRELETSTHESEWHEKPLPLILRSLNVTQELGLSAAEAQLRLTQHGPNALEAEKRTPVYIVFALQFMNLIIGLLVIAALASIVLQEFVEGIAILAIVTLNAVIATAQELSASNALDALQKMTSPECVVVRDGRQAAVPSKTLVPGDIVVLATGDVVPADLRLLHSADLKVNEMILTGESEDVLKRYNASDVVGAAPRREKLTAENMVFASTSVATGNATGVVVATGMATRVGAIAALLKTGGGAGAKRSKNCIKRFMEQYYPKMTPLQESLHKLGVVMGTAVIGVCVVVFVVGMLRDTADPKNPDRPVWLNMVMIAVSLAVSAVPEGLPMVVTICLSTGTADMVQQHVLVRKLVAVESLGAASVICTDKTGTLTEGKMTAVKLWGDGVQYDITGVGGFTPSGDILCSGVSHAQSNAQVRATLLSAVLCSNTSLQREESTETSVDGSGSSSTRVTWVPMGNSSEAPLVVAAAKAGIWRDAAMAAHPRVSEIPFSSSRKMMITVTELTAPVVSTATASASSADTPVAFERVALPPSTQFVAHVKGAPNYIVQHCTQYVRADGSIATMPASERLRVLDAVDALSSQALRVLAVALRPLEKLPFDASEEDIEVKFAALREPLVFVGLIASIDPPRAGVQDAIHRARAASIRTVMITGDYLQTAVAIAKQIDLLQVGTDAAAEAVDCSVLRPRQGVYLADADVDAITSRVSVFARAKPEDKIAIVQSLQRQGHVSAMTGDGVNDAPALKEADIGVAMGLAGTAVAKGASDMVLTDDNFCSIVAAVEKGREIYANIQRFVCFLLSTNFGEITVIFLALAVGMPNPLEPLQILVLNLFADGMAAVALSLEKGDGTVMLERPRPRTQPIIHGRLWVLVLFNAFLIASGALVVFTTGLYWNFGHVLQNDILAGVDTRAGEAAYKDVVCSRWQGVRAPRVQITNCAAQRTDGSGLFVLPDSVRADAPAHFVGDGIECYSGDFDCVSEGIARAQTMAFVYITMMEMLRAYTARSFTKSVFHAMFANKWMQWAAVGSIVLTLSVTNIPVVMDDLFGFAHIAWYEWLYAIAFALLMVVFGETMKWGYRRRDRQTQLVQTVQDKYADMMLEIRSLRLHVERLEGKLDVDMEFLRANNSHRGRSSTSSSNSDSDLDVVSDVKPLPFLRG